MNPIVLSTIVASSGIIISIFAANWLNQQHVNKLMEQNQQFLKLLMEQMEKRFPTLR